MEFRQLRTFKAVADCLSFTRAAGELYMAQSSVSAQIKALEEELDIRLFDRIGRQIALTDAGRRLYDYARRITEMDKEIRSRVAGQDSTLEEGSLVIRVPDTLATVYMPGIIAAYHKAHPRVRLDFINCTDLRLKEELNTGKIDLAFLMTDAVTLRDVNVRLIGTEDLVMASGPDHPLAENNRISYEDLQGQTLLLPRTD